MIVHTKYRDIPWEEAKKCAKPEAQTLLAELSWSRLRGTAIAIKTPAYDVTPADIARHAIVCCEGPFYPVITHDSALVCPHIAEIGD